MRRRLSRVRFSRPSAPLIISILALVLAAGGFAWAAIPDSSGVIHGCYDSTASPAQLSVFDSSASKCPPGQSELTWNQAGATGPAGAPGPAGPQGPPGNANAQEIYNRVYQDIYKPGALTVKYYAEIDRDPVKRGDYAGAPTDGSANFLTAYRLSPGVGYSFEPAGGKSVFSFPESVDGCIPVVNSFHRAGRGGTDRIDNPDIYGSATPDNITPAFHSYARFRDDHTIYVITREYSTYTDTSHGRTVQNAAYVTYKPFSLLLFCPPERLALAQAPAPPPQVINDRFHVSGLAPASPAAVPKVIRNGHARSRARRRRRRP